MQTVLESGSLPVSFEFAQSQTVGPTLGQDALASGVLVAGIGLALVMLYLLLFYHGLGLITAAAMAVFAALYLGILAVLSHFGLFQPVACGHRGHRAHHRHGGRLVHSDARAFPRRRLPHGPKRARRFENGRASRHHDLDRRRLGDACSRAHAVLAGKRFGERLRPYARARHSVRHRHDAAVQGFVDSPARPALHREASRILGAFPILRRQRRISRAKKSLPKAKSCAAASSSAISTFSAFVSTS